MNVFNYLNLRSQWEDLARNFVGVNQHGTIESLQDFVENGHRKNRFRDGYEEAMELAEMILRGA